jgi:hypothetical protein
MNAEERHEERENDAAGWLQYGFVNWIREYGSYVLLVGALGFLGYQLWNMHEQKIEAAHEDAFNTLHEATKKDAGGPGFGNINPADPVALGDLIDKTEFKEVKAEAALTLAGYYQDLVAFPEELKAKNLRRDEVLSKAFGNFQIALDAKPNDLLISSCAHLGMAAVYEDQAEWAKAKDEYTLLSDPKGNFADTPIADLAAGRLKTLPKRQAAPRLVAMIPEPKPATAPSVLNMPGSKGLMDLNTPLPGLLGPTYTPPSRPTTPQLPATPMGPFQGPTIPGITPGPERSVDTAPATPTPATAPAK